MYSRPSVAARFCILGFVAVALCVGRPEFGWCAGEPVESSREQSLDGTWRIAFDPKDVGKNEGWFKAGVFPLGASRAFEVPGTLWTVDPKYRGVVWCAREFTPTSPASGDLRYYLRFGAVAYACDVWLNGVPLGSHEGAQSPFEFDATKALSAKGPNHLVVRVFGHVNSDQNGINQRVTLAARPVVRIKDAFAKPDYNTGRIELQVTLENNSGSGAGVALRAAYGEFKPPKALGVVEAKADAPPGVSVKTLTVPIEHRRLWDIDDPFLYTIAVTSDWSGASSPATGRDSFALRAGFRDFRIVNGYFRLNGNRIFPKSSHSSWYDPIVMRGTPRDMKYLNEDFALMKRAGFNMFRFIVSSPLPEQLDQADELGLLIYCEHETSWLQTDTTKFGVSLDDVVRRDRNHPSLVMWGLLNETPPGRFYDAAKTRLPSLRSIDDTRLVMLSSGRWDGNLKTGSASNPGSKEWDVCLGGEDPTTPSTAGAFPFDVGGYIRGVGDAHIYQTYPTTWAFVEAFANLGREGKTIFLSEAGIGSSYNAPRDQRKMREAGAPNDAPAWEWINTGVNGLRQAWPKYHLETLYPSIDEMPIDSELNAARQRELMFSIVRANPKINGYSLTSWVDCWGAAEGVVDGFREFKPGHLPVLQAGWAKLRWCLLMNPMHGYADRPFHLKIALASEDALSAGNYPATLRIKGPQGVLWEKAATITVPAGPDPPLAYAVFEGDVTIPGLAEGTYMLSAALDNRENAASHELSFFVADKSKLPRDLGPVTVLGINESLREFLAAHGATLRDYAPDQAFDREVIVVGEAFPGKTPTDRAAAWRALYGRVARGAHAVFLAPSVFEEGKNSTKWLALATKGERTGEHDWLYHKDVIAKPHPFLAGLQTKIMTPDYYGELLAGTKFFWKIAPPDEAAAVAIRMSNYPFEFKEGLMLGTYRHGAGRFTIHGFNLLPTLGQPATDRLLLNMITHAKSTASPLQPLPAKHDAQLDALGIK